MGSKDKVTITFTYRTILRVVVVGLLALLFIALMGKIAHTLALIFIAFFLSIALNPAVSKISKSLKSKSRVRATGVAYLLVLLVTAGFLMLVVPTITTQTSNFVRELPDTFDEITSEESTVTRVIRDYNLEDDIDNATVSIKNRYLSEGGDTVFNTASRVSTIVISIIVVLTLTFMMLVEGPDWMKYFWSMQDPDDVPKRKRMVTKMYRVVTGYVNGQLLIALIAGTSSFIALMAGNAIFGGNINAVVYALIITLTSLIPMFGATIGAVIVVILCSFTSLPLAVAMGIFFLAYQQIENITIQPLIQSWQSELTPLIVFISAIIGISFGGILGAFVAIPIAACIKIALLEHFGHNLNNLEEKLSKEVA